MQGFVLGFPNFIGFTCTMDRAAVAAIAALEDDLRRALYEHVCEAPRPVTRDEAAQAVNASRCAAVPARIWSAGLR